MLLMKKLVVLKAGSCEWRGWGIFNDEEQLRMKLMQTYSALTEGFDMERALEERDMMMVWADDFSMQIFL
jgi:hypothetical protein